MDESGEEGCLSGYGTMDGVETVTLDCGRGIVLVGENEFDDDGCGGSAYVDQILFHNDRYELG